MLPEIFDHAVAQWRAGRLSGGEGLLRMADAFARTADPATNVTVVDVGAADPGDFAITRAVHNVDLRATWNRLCDYPDNDYVARHVVPQYSHVKAAGEPFADTVRARIQGTFAVYDRLLLPAGAGSRHLLSLTRTRMLIEPFATPDDPHVTPREADIVSSLASGLSAKETARALNLSPRTVEHRIDALKRRFGARNVTHLVCLVMAQGLIGAVPIQPSGRDDED